MIVVLLSSIFGWYVSWVPTGFHWDLYDGGESNEPYQTDVNGGYTRDCVTLPICLMNQALDGATTTAQYREHLIQLIQDQDQKDCANLLFNAYGY